MILEHSNAAPYNVQQTQGVAAVWKHKENPTIGADLAHWTVTLGHRHNTCKVTNSTERIIQEPNFCHDNCKNLAKMRQVRQGAVGCQKIVTLW
jgi:hypothetical protein